MTQSKVVLTDRTAAPFVAPNTLVLYMRGNTLYMKTEGQEEIQVTCSASDITEIKAVTDNLPDSGTLTSIAQASALATVDTVVDGIKAVTDALPDAGALTSISDETDKIDGAATLGLAGTDNSLAYRVHEVERHFHSYESWFGVAAAPNGEIHVADRIGSGINGFVIDAGNLTWGSWVQILGSSDTPARGSNERYDLHRILVTAAERTTAVYFVQIAFGASGADAYTAGAYTEFTYYSPASVSRSAPTDFQTRRIAAGTKAWARCLCRGQNTGTLTFYFGLHGYEG